MSEHVESVAENEEVVAPVETQAEPVETQAAPVEAQAASVEAQAASETEAMLAEEPVAAALEAAAQLDETEDATTGGDQLSASVEPEVAEAAVETPVAAGAEQAEEATGEGEEADDGSSRVVRTLHVGQEVTGTVKRITDFGAFVDIGVGRDGLLHVSELSIQRIGKVSDVLSEGEQITVWIKELDRKRNRISLTKIAPGTKTIRDLEKGEIVNGTVTRILPYGAFIDIGIGRDALLHVREMSNGYVAKPDDVVQVGEEVEARIVDISRRRSRVDLSLKGLRPEPEQEAAMEAQVANADQADMAEPEDQFEDAVVLTAMELAFKRAMEGDGGEGGDTAKQKEDRKRPQMASIQDEIIARTLETRS